MRPSNDHIGLSGDNRGAFSCYTTTNRSVGAGHTKLVPAAHGFSNPFACNSPHRKTTTSQYSITLFRTIRVPLVGIDHPSPKMKIGIATECISVLRQQSTSLFTWPADCRVDFELCNSYRTIRRGLQRPRQLSPKEFKNAWTDSSEENPID